MDLGSRDGSADLARASGARVIVRDPVPVVERVRNEVADHAVHDWILVMDPDERVREGLAAGLRRAAGRDDIDAVVVPRMNVDFGHVPSQPMHRYEPQIRMYHRLRVRWPEVPNELPRVAEDRLHRIPPRDESVLVHDRNRSIPEMLERVVRYAPAEAQAMVESGRVFSVDAMMSHLGRKAHKQFIRGDPWREGFPGVLRACVLFLFHFFVWATFWQLSGGNRTEEDDRAIRRTGGIVKAVYRIGRGLRAPLEVFTRFRR